jgi:hypothetical protein
VRPSLVQIGSTASGYLSVQPFYTLTEAEPLARALGIG